MKTAKIDKERDALISNSWFISPLSSLSVSSRYLQFCQHVSTRFKLAVCDNWVVYIVALLLKHLALRKFGIFKWYAFQSQFIPFYSFFVKTGGWIFNWTLYFLLLTACIFISLLSPCSFLGSRSIQNHVSFAFSREAFSSERHIWESLSCLSNLEIHVKSF